MRVIALDPGGRTGIALWQDGQFWSTHLGTYEAWHWVANQLETTRTDLVVCEDFIITIATAKKSQDGKKSLESIGVFRYLCAVARVSFETQTPADAKNFVDNDRLRHLGMWYKGSDHPRDAARHLILALSSRGLLKPSDLLETNDPD